MATKERITRREVTDPVALQTVVDQLRERVNTEDAATNTVLIGPWYVTNIAQSAGAVDMVLASGTSEFVAPRDGTIVGVVADLTVAVTAATLLLKAMVTEDGTASVAYSYNWPLVELEYVPDDLKPYEFKRGARLKMGYDADATFTPDGTPDLTAWLEVKM